MESPDFLMVRAIHGGFPAIITELVGLGVNLHTLTTPNGPICPFSIMAYSSPAQTRATALRLLQLGVSPNRCVLGMSWSAGMLSAPYSPELLDVLLANGGDPNLEAPNGQNVLSAWVQSYWGDLKGPRRAQALATLDALLAAGMKTNTLVHEHFLSPRGPRKAALAEMWIDGAMRTLIPDLIARGFDPRQAGDDGVSLMDKLAPKLKKGAPSPLVTKIVAAMSVHAPASGQVASAAAPAPAPIAAPAAVATPAPQSAPAAVTPSPVPTPAAPGSSSVDIKDFLVATFAARQEPTRASEWKRRSKGLNAQGEAVRTFEHARLGTVEVVATSAGFALTEVPPAPAPRSPGP